MRSYPPEQRAEARALKKQGMSPKQISLTLGIPYATVLRWCDPKVHKRSLKTSREYKKRRRRTCEECGKSVWLTSRLCQGCHSARRRRWTQEAIIGAIHQFNEEHGRPPLALEWVKRSPMYPSPGTVLARFGSWAAAIEAAGYPRPLVGRKLVNHRDERTKVKQLYEDGQTIEQLAEQFRLSPSIVRQYLASTDREFIPRAAGPPKKDKRTREQRIEDLRKALGKET